MQKGKSIKINMIMNMLLTLSSMVFPLITYPYISRVLLPVGVGKVYFALSIVTYFTMFAQLGVPVYGVRACAQVRENAAELSKTVRELVTLNVLMSLPVYMVYALAVAFVPRLNADWRLFAIVGISIFLNAINTDWFYQAIEEYSYITIRSLFFKTIGLISVFILVRGQSDYIFYGGIMIFAASASSIWNLIHIRKYMVPAEADMKKLRSHLKISFSFFMLSVMTTVYTNLDVAMLGFMADDSVVGYYGTAAKIKLILVGFITAASGVVLPRASNQISSERHEEFTALLRKTMHFVVLLSFSLTVYFVIYSKDVILVLAGRAFIDAATCLSVIVLTLIPISISNVIGVQMMVPLGLEKKTVKAVTFAAVGDVVLNLMLIPKLGDIGAAIGTLAAEFIVLASLMLMTKGLWQPLFNDMKPTSLVSSAALAAAISLVPRLVVSNSFLIIVVSGVIYYAVYITSLVITKDQLAKDFFKTIKKKVIN